METQILIGPDYELKGKDRTNSLNMPNQLGAGSLTSQCIDWLLAPVSFDEFVTEYWDQSPLYIEGRGADYYSEIYTLSDFDSALSNNSIRSPFLRLVRDGNEIPLAELSSSGYARANVLEEVFAQYREGASIVLQFLHEQNERLMELSRHISIALSTYVQVNAYLTPMGERGLGTHFDTHDVFVMQIHGSKDWTLYDRTHLAPFKNERGSRTEMNNAKPTRSFTMSPGDNLYIPRGWIHKAESRDMSSLHLTIGVHPLRWGQVFLGAVTELIKKDQRFRSALPAGFATCAQQRQVTLNYFHELFSVVTQGIDPVDLLDDAVSSARCGTQPYLKGHLLDLHKIDQIDQSTRLKIRNIDGLSIEDDDSIVRVSYHGKVMECPAVLSESLRFVTGKEVFTTSELPDMLTTKDKLVFTRRLVKEGLLTFADEM